MQPIKELTRLLERLEGEEHYLFSLDDTRNALPGASTGAFNVLLSRTEKSGILRRDCRGIYLYPRVAYPTGLVLFHTAAKLRADGFSGHILSVLSLMKARGRDGKHETTLRRGRYRYSSVRQ